MEYYKQIADYLQGNLTETQQEAFEAKLSYDAELKRAVKLHSSTLKVYDVLLEESTMSQIKQSDPHSNQFNVSQERGGTVFNFKKLVSIAATFLMVILCTGWWYANSYYTNEALVERFVDQPNLSGNRSGEVVNSVLLEAKVAFSKGDYTHCLALLSSIGSENPDFAESRFIMGYAYLMSRQPVKAIAVLSEMTQSNSGTSDWATFYMTLAYLQAGDTDNAKMMINSIISNPSHLYRDRARDLQQHLDSFWRKLENPN